MKIHDIIRFKKELNVIQNDNRICPSKIILDNCEWSISHIGRKEREDMLRMHSQFLSLQFFYKYSYTSFGVNIGIFTAAFSYEEDFRRLKFP